MRRCGLATWRRRFVRSGVAVLVSVSTTATGLAQERTAAGLANLTLEQLIEVELVSVASKRPQEATKAPSVVMVVTDDEIRRQGHRTLGDVLRTLPGFYVSYDRNYSYVGTRGFGRPGDYNTRVLVLIDGVRTNDNVYDGSYVGQEAPLDPDLIERIEISRGPGAAIYGNNAFFAVVDIVTKRGKDISGGELQAGASSFGTHGGRATYGRTLADGTDFVASASILESDGQTLWFPEFADTDGGSVAGADGERSRRAFASFSKGGFTAEALHSSRSKHIPTASYETVFGDTRAMTRDSFSLAALSYARSFGPRFDLSSRLSYVAYDYKGAYPYEMAPGDVTLYDDYASSRRWSAETTGVLQAGRHILMLGGELIDDSRQEQGGIYTGLPDTAFSIKNHGVRYGVFLQDEVELKPWLRMSIGGRYDHHEDFGGEANPRLALIASPDAATTFKLLYGTSYRAPNEYERHYYAAQQSAPFELTPERIRTAEAALERSLGDHLRLTASVFSNDIRDLITLETDPAGELLYRNTDRARSKGGEIALEAKLPSGIAGRLSYSYQHTRNEGCVAAAAGVPDEVNLVLVGVEDQVPRVKTGQGLGPLALECEASRPLSNSPSNMLKASVAVPLKGQEVWAALNAQYVGSRLTLSGGETSDFVLVNATLFAARFKGGLEASASVYNLFDVRYSDPGSEEHRQDAIRQDGRSFALTLGWRF